MSNRQAAIAAIAVLLALTFLPPVRRVAADQDRETSNRPHAPIDLGAGNTEDTGINYASAAVTYADGTIESFFRRSADGQVTIQRVRSRDQGRSWSEPEVLVRLPIAPWGGPMPLLDQDQELHFVIPRVRGDGRRPGIDRFVDLYHVRSTGDRTAWTEPRRIFEGYCGAIQGVFQLRSGRIIAPFADWIGGRRRGPPTGPSETTCVYSDDGGATWKPSPSRLTAPCYEDYNGGNYGACEPTLLELRDGRCWMLIRTQTGRLYESFSEDGSRWSEAEPSRFHSSNSPAFPIRLEDGRIVVFWNNCEMPPRVDGAGVYGGRDALHAAISDDEGRTWRGFREVYRDPTRNGTPPSRGDRGTAYPHATLVPGGKILLVSGQGSERRRRFLIDPEWLLETRAEANMQSLDEWHVFKGFGPAAGFWRDRKMGARIVPHPDHPEQARVLQVRRADELEPDGAVWNFPAGQAGAVTLRIRVEPGSGGASVSLTDRFFDPCDDAGEQQAVFIFEVPGDGQLAASSRLEPGEWHTVRLSWTAEGEGTLSLDGQVASKLKARRPFPNGLSYLRLRSIAEQPDPRGFLVAAASAEVAPAD